MKDFANKLAAITGGGTGIGRELARQLAAEGCHLALCDVSAEAMQETRRLCLGSAPEGTRITTHVADVADEAQVLAFRDAATGEHATDHIDLLFNNAGIGGGGSFVNASREEWERTFNVCWGGVYFCTRAFLPLLIASTEAHIVNTSSINGFWASIGYDRPHTAYSAAKFAVKGFTEALINDLRLNAPHVKCSLVMPGHIGTSIVRNTREILTGKTLAQMGPAEMVRARESIAASGVDPSKWSDERLRAIIADAQCKRSARVRDKAVCIFRRPRWVRKSATIAVAYGTASFARREIGGIAEGASGCVAYATDRFAQGRGFGRDAGGLDSGEVGRRMEVCHALRPFSGSRHATTGQ